MTTLKQFKWRYVRVQQKWFQMIFVNAKPRVTDFIGSVIVRNLSSQRAQSTLLIIACL